MPAKIPDSVKPLLDEYLQLIQSELPGLMTACYLHGSLALDAFNPGLSDIDFITVISSRCTEADFNDLAKIHQSLEQKYPKLPMQGSYLQLSDLGKSPAGIEPAPYYSDGVLHPAGHHDVNAITWWLLKNRGITLFGKAATSLDYSVDMDVLVADTLKNMNTYWVTYIRQLRRIAWLFSDYGIQWTVTGVLRQWYTLKERDITSKIGAGEYALKHLPEKWHRIVQEAINIRRGGRPSLYLFPVLRAIEAWRFLRYIIHECNTKF
jgi:hypothetical protein